MPKTDAQWQALDARIAREVMGWQHVEELPEDVECIQLFPGKTGDRSGVWRSRFGTKLTNGGWFEFREDLAYTPYPGLIIALPWVEACKRGSWQPHKNVAQAVVVKNKVMSQGWRFEMRGFPSLVCSASFWQPGGRQFMGNANSDAKAICLAVEALLDAQGLSDRQVTG